MKVKTQNFKGLVISLILLYQLFAPSAAFSQENSSTVRGIVHGENGSPLANASVVIRNNSTNFMSGTKTDSAGVFTANVSPGGPYSFTFSNVGFETQTLSGYNLKAGTVFSLDVELKASSKALDQVVVIGYGSLKKSDVTGAISSVSANTIARAATIDPAGALQGNVPGVVVVKNTGKPGSGYNISIRGTSSIGGSSSPLFVIDGIPSNSGLNELNPADIEKIDVLKDASATAIYGSRGAKGVVIVTTKRGRPGKTMISYDAYMGARVPTHLPTMFDGKEYVAFRTELFNAQGRSTDRSNTAFFTADQWANIDAGRFTDWPSLILKNGLQMNHNVTASGGDALTRFSISAGLLKEDGNVAPENFQRYTLRGNIDRQVNKHWKAGLSFYLAQNLQDMGSNETLRSAYRLPATQYPYDSTGARLFRVFPATIISNPLFDQENDLRQNRYLRTFGNLYIQVEPIDHLVLKSTIYPSFYSARNGNYFGPLSKQGVGTLSGATNSSSEQFTWVLDNQATYDAQFGSHKLTATIVQSIQKDRVETNTISAEQLPYKSLWYNIGTGGRITGIGSSFTKYTLVSAMGRLNYSFKEKYLLTATGRWDGSSRLAVGNQWGFFPSGSVAWRISKEKFMEKISAVNDLKLRVSYGLTGNDRVNPYSTQATLGQTFYDFGGTVANGYAPSQLANKDLTWEITKEINVGVDFAVVNSRISGSVDLYSRKIDNILLSRDLPAPVGFGSITQNIGKLQNTGIEIGLSTMNIQAGKFSWKTDIVFDRNKNKILDLLGGNRDIIGSALFIGQPVQVNYDYVFDGIWQNSEKDAAAKYNQKPGQIRVKDLNNDGIINASDRAIIGKRVPTWTGSISNTFRYGNLDLYIMIYTRRGEQFNSSFDATFMSYNAEVNQVKVDYWTPSNPSQKYFQPGNPGPYSGVVNYRNVDFTRVGNITLGYNLPAKLLKRYGFSNFRIYGTATNPFLFTKYEGYDPEWPSQNTFGTAIGSSSYLLGLNVSF